MIVKESTFNSYDIANNYANELGYRINANADAIEELAQQLAEIESPDVVQPRLSVERPSVEPSFLDPNNTAEPQYRISDAKSYEDGEEDYDDYEDFYVEDAAEIRGQQIPSWARAVNLLEELRKQQSIDPDKVFVGFERSCDLSRMFSKKKANFSVRGDSGWWANDTFTEDEERHYKQAVGLNVSNE